MAAVHRMLRLPLAVFVLVLPTSPGFSTVLNEKPDFNRELELPLYLVTGGVGVANLVDLHRGTEHYVLAGAGIVLGTLSFFYAYDGPSEYPGLGITVGLTSLVSGLTSLVKLRNRAVTESPVEETKTSLKVNLGLLAVPGGGGSPGVVFDFRF